MIGVVDYGMGNLKSVCNSLEHIGEAPVVLGRPQDFEGVTHLILPGVGAFAAAMDNLHGRGLVAPILNHVAAGKPFLGICLGMQLLAEAGSEPVETKGLALIAGRVDKMASGVRLPHVGWNNLDFVRPHPLFEGVKRNVDFYFVHSYHFSAPAECELGISDYGGRFCAIVGRDNIVGIQFHPEKSQDNGLKMLENFAQWDGRC
jgi:glutamine amidotransferase